VCHVYSSVVAALRIADWFTKYLDLK